MWDVNFRFVGHDNSNYAGVGQTAPCGMVQTVHNAHTPPHFMYGYVWCWLRRMEALVMRFTRNPHTDQYLCKSHQPSKQFSWN